MLEFAFFQRTKELTLIFLNFLKNTCVSHNLLCKISFVKKIPSFFNVWLEGVEIVTWVGVSSHHVSEWVQHFQSCFWSRGSINCKADPSLTILLCLLHLRFSHFPNTLSIRIQSIFGWRETEKSHFYTNPRLVKILDSNFFRSLCRLEIFYAQLEVHITKWSLNRND